MIHLQGKKRYRLAFTVMQLPNHFVARIKLKDGFYIIDDNESLVDCAMTEDEYFPNYRTWIDDIYDKREYAPCDIRKI